MALKLLRHPIPYKDESLANYFYRLALDNCSQISWLLPMVGLGSNANFYTINRIYNRKVIDKLIETINLSIKKIRYRS